MFSLFSTALSERSESLAQNDLYLTFEKYSKRLKLYTTWYGQIMPQRKIRDWWRPAWPSPSCPAGFCLVLVGEHLEDGLLQGQGVAAPFLKILPMFLNRTFRFHVDNLTHCWKFKELILSEFTLRFGKLKMCTGFALVLSSPLFCWSSGRKSDRVSRWVYMGHRPWARRPIIIFVKLNSDVVQLGPRISHGSSHHARACQRREVHGVVLGVVHGVDRHLGAWDQPERSIPAQGSRSHVERKEWRLSTEWFIFRILH